MPTAGETISLGEAKMTFYGPLENDYQYGRTVDLNTRQENKYSIVTKIVYGSNSFLMTGDAQKETIEKIFDGNVCEEFLNVLFTERKACRASVYHSSESFSVGFTPGGYLKFISK